MNPGESAIEVRDVSEMLKVSASKIQTMCALGEIPFVRLGRRILFFRSDIESWINSKMYVPKK
jgi:excisionase family DNA binding protein